MKNKYTFSKYFKQRCLSIILSILGNTIPIFFIIIVPLVTIALIALLIFLIILVFKILSYFYFHNPMLIISILTILVLALIIAEIIIIIHTIQQDYQKYKRSYYKEHNYEK